MKFCQTCFDRIAAAWAKKNNYNPRCKLKIKGMVFPCQVPIYDHNSATGQPTVRIFNCKENRVEIMPLKEYNDRLARGEASDG